MSRRLSVSTRIARKNLRPLLAAVVAVPTVLTVTHTAQAQTSVYWDLNGTTAGAGVPTAGIWSTTDANWNASSAGTGTLSVWVSNNNARFSAGTDATASFTVTVSGNVSVNQIGIEEGTASVGPTFSGGTLTLGAGSSSTNVLLGISTGVTTSATIGSVVAGTHGLLLGRNLAAGDVLTITSTNNPLTGGISIGSGTTLKLSNANAFANAGVVTISGGTLTTTNKSQTFAGIVSSSGSSTIALGTGTLTLNLASAASTSWYASDITGAGGIVITGASNGTQILSTNYGYTGPTVINSGILKVDSLNNAGSGSSIGASSVANSATNLVLNGGTLWWAGPTTQIVAGSTTNRNYTLGINGGTIDGSGTGFVTFTGNMTASGSAGSQTFNLIGSKGGVISGSINDGTGSNTTALSKSGTGTWTLSGTNTYSGNTSITAGTLSIGSAAALNTDTSIIASGGVLALSTFGATVTGVSVAGGSITGTVVPLTSNTAFDFQSGSVSAILAGTSGAIKTTSGSLDLTAANTYSGGTQINAGTLRVNNNASLGAANSPVSLADNVTLSTTATTARTLTYAWTVNGDPTLGQATVGTGALTLAGTMDLGGSTRTFTLANAADTISAAVSNGGITLGGSGTGTLTLSGANSYAGNTIINTGTLAANADTRFGAIPDSPTSGSIQINDAALSLTAGFELNSNRGITLGGSGGTLGVTTGTVTYAGIIDGSSLTKIGTGNLLLTGANTYGGSTTVNAGALIFNASSALPSSTTITANAGGTAAAGGTLPFDQAFLGYITTGSAGVAALAANSANDLDLSSYSTLRIGSIGTTTYSGNLTPSNNTYLLGGGGGNLVVASNLTDVGAVTTSLDVGVNGTNASTVTLIGSNNYTGTTTIGPSSSLSIGNGGLTGNVPTSSITDNGTLIVNHGDDLTFSTDISGSGSFTKAGTNVLLLAGNNSFTGAVLVNAGSLVIQDPAKLGSGAKTVTANGTGGLHLDGSLADMTVPSSYSLVTTGSALFNDAGNNTVQGTITVASTTDTTITASAGTLTLAGDILPNTTGRSLKLDGAGAGVVTGVIRDGSTTNKLLSLVKQGAGTWTINTPATYTGTASVTNGTLAIGVDNALPATAVTVTSSGTLDLNTHALAVNTLSGTGAVAASGPLTISGTANTTFTGTIAGAGSLTKLGTSTQLIGPVTLPNVTVSAGTLGVAPSTPTALSIGTLTASTGKFNLGTGKLALTSMSSDDARFLLSTGLGGTAGLLSSSSSPTTGIGYLPASALGITGPSVWNGASVDSSSILLSYTSLGDINLNGVIDQDDYALLDRAFAKHVSNAHWIDGDFNYDGIVDSTDFADIDRAFSIQNGGTFDPSLLAHRESQFGDAYVQSLIASVPEPTSLLTACGFALPLLTRRRRQA